MLVTDGKPGGNKSYGVRQTQNQRDWENGRYKPEKDSTCTNPGKDLRSAHTKEKVVRPQRQGLV